MISGRKLRDMDWLSWAWNTAKGRPVSFMLTAAFLWVLAQAGIVESLVPGVERLPTLAQIEVQVQNNTNATNSLQQQVSEAAADRNEIKSILQRMEQNQRRSLLMQRRQALESRISALEIEMYNYQPLIDAGKASIELRQKYNQDRVEHDRLIRELQSLPNPDQTGDDG